MKPVKQKINEAEEFNNETQIDSSEEYEVFLPKGVNKDFWNRVDNNEQEHGDPEELNFDVD